MKILQEILFLGLLNQSCIYITEQGMFMYVCMRASSTQEADFLAWGHGKWLSHLLPILLTGLQLDKSVCSWRKSFF